MVPTDICGVTERSPESLPELLARDQPVLALAPMQDITDRPFLGLMAKYGGADLYFTEYFRVYPHSKLNRHILRSITETRPIDP
jgi:tRNA-dihydrouridine synthase B